MNDILLVFLSLSFSGSILALLLMAINPLIKSRLSHTWQYYIWLIIILRFLLPFTPQISIVGEVSRHIQNITNSSVLVETNTGFDLNEEYEIPQTPDTPQISDGSAPHNIVTKTPARSTFWRDVLNNSWLLWIGVALVLFVHKIASYRSFMRFVKCGAKEINDAHIWDIYEAELATAKIKKPLPFYINSQVVSPMLVGITRPTLVIPVLDINGDELRHIFRHELTHYKRLDSLYKWIVQIVLCLHWFNPLVYLINKQINKSCELSCDEAVIKHLDEDSRMIYGDALMTSLTAQGNYSNFVVSITMSENANLVKERLDAIVCYKKKSGLVFCVTALLTALLFCGFTFTGAYEAANSSGIIPALNEKPTFSQDHLQADSSAATSANTMPQANTNLSTDENKGKSSYTSRTDSLMQNFKKYKPYGIIYNAEQDAVYYNGERVKLFVDFKQHNEEGITYAFDLCYQDSNTDSILYLEAVKDNSGNITGIRRLKKEIAVELLSDMNEITPYQEHNSNNGNSKVLTVTMDATQVLENYGIVAKDLTKDKAAENIKVWMEQCDKKQGAYILKTQAANGYVTYIYYNGGGRYPWNLSINNGEINANLYSDSELATTDGYYLMYFTSPIAYENINLYLNNVELKYSATPLTNNQPFAAENSVAFNQTSVARNWNSKEMKSGNWFGWDRVDVVDESGLAYQAVIFAFKGSDSYKQKFNAELQQLRGAYPDSNTISGYLSPVRDNRTRNFGDADFFAIEKVIMTDKNGDQADAYIIAVCGSDNFMKAYDTFFDTIVNEYFKAENLNL